MSRGRFEELLRQMPKIAKAVNAFQSETLQQSAYNALMDAFHRDAQMDDGTATGRKSDRSKKEEEERVTSYDGSKGGAASSSKDQKKQPTTAEILAQARAAAASVPKASDGERGATTAVARAEQGKEIKEAKGIKEAKPSAVEGIKESSNFLRGTIAETLRDDQADHFSKDDAQLLKFHGSYQQDNRDVRAKTGSGKSEKAYMLMVRTKIPGGRLTSRQLLAELDLCDQVGNQTLRMTSRQGLQLHGVVKRNVKETIRRINEIQLSTLGACGDVNRNVMCCPAPYKGPAYEQAQEVASQLAAHFAPRTRAYHEIWLADVNGDNKQLVSDNGAEEEVEPIYGRHYLPRKFKIGIAFPEDNCTDVYTNDLGLLGVVRDDRLVGFNFAVGGGMGVTPSAKKTFPALGQRMAFVPLEQVLDVATAVVGVQRDFGNRSDRKRARLKYLIHDWGLEAFRTKVEEYLGYKLRDPEADEVHGCRHHLGWEAQGDGKWFYGLNIENGRIQDTDDMRLKSALREICRELSPGIHLTAYQSMLLTGIADEQRSRLEDILRQHGVPLSEDTSTVRRWSMACVAWPTCGLSITEAERALPGVLDQLEVELARLGLAKEEFTVRMTGCPNGCVRPYNADIGLVGKARGKYTVFLGGGLRGHRLSFLYKDLVPQDELIPTLVPVLSYFKQDRQGNESFGDFCARKGQAELLAWAEKAEGQQAV